MREFDPTQSALVIQPPPGPTLDQGLAAQLSAAMLAQLDRDILGAFGMPAPSLTSAAASNKLTSFDGPPLTFDTLKEAWDKIKGPDLTKPSAPIKLSDVSSTAAHSSQPGALPMPRQNAIQTTNPGTGQTEPQYIDVELHGVAVPLLELKRALRADKKLKQEDLAAQSAAFNSGTALHQTSISGYLIGKVEMHAAVVALLESIFDGAEVASMAGKAPSAIGTAPKFKPAIPLGLPVATQGGAAGASTVTTPGGAAAAAAAPSAPSAPVIPPAFAGATAAAAGATTLDPVKPAAAPAPQAAVVSMTAFPLAKAYEVAADVRKAQADGSHGTTFSLRKLQQWGRAYYLLAAEGYSEKDALAGAFHLAVEGKTYGEDKTFLGELFQAKFGFDVKPPKAPTSRRKQAGGPQAGVKHPLHGVVLPMVREGLHLWLAGPTGAGKTHALLDIGAELGREVVRFQGKGDATTDDFVGGFGLVERNGLAVSEFQYGVLPQAMQRGAVLYIDEITSLPPEVLFELHAVMEGKPLVLSKNRGEVVHPQPGFVIVAADNSLGLGEATEYVGTNVMNEALRDRFLMVHFEYMPEAMEKAALQGFLDAFTTARGWVAA